jgi:hypothetical protein
MYGGHFSVPFGTVPQFLGGAICRSVVIALKDGHAASDHLFGFPYGISGFVEIRSKFE